jgi:uncharacterized protein YebE (UPF0316 family)
MESILGTLLIFCLRIIDVSLGTMRMIYTIRGRRFVAAGLGLVEASVFIFAISRVMREMHDPMRMVGYAAGFACGTLLGMTIEKWIAGGSLLFRIIARKHPHELTDALRKANYGVTLVHGEGRDGPVLVLFVVAPRKLGGRVLKQIQEIEPTAFITIDPISRAIGGHVPHVVPVGVLRK